MAHSHQSVLMMLSCEPKHATVHFKFEGDRILLKSSQLRSYF